MKVQPIERHEQAEVRMAGAVETKMRMLIGPADGAANFHMRHFEIAPGGHTPRHHHDFEHEILILSGSGVVKSTEGDRRFSPNDVIFIPPNEEHQFVNDGDQACTFLCLIPAPGDGAK